MANVWFCSDLHFGHKNIDKFRKGFRSEQEHREYIKYHWEKAVTKRDTVFVLGDAAFTEESVVDFKGLKGRKFLIRGNHDLLKTSTYLEYFEEVYGLLKYKEFWLSHAPIHPNELRNKINLHGHVHYATVPDNRYVNICVENLEEVVGRPLISLQEVREHVSKRLGG